jgi:hypothetical protein
MSKLDEVEDYLQGQGVFVSGVNGRPAHMDSYMTCMDFKAFDKAMKSPPFTKTELLEAASRMAGFGYLSPMAGLASFSIQSKLCPAFSPLVTQARVLEQVIKKESAEYEKETRRGTTSRLSTCTPQ